jgi:hypothetical protein
MSVLALLLGKCRGNTASVKELHVLNWALRNVPARESFLRAYTGKSRPGDVTLRFDPTLDRTIDRARGESLVQWTTNGRLRLTPSGERLLAALLDSEALTDERAFLDEIPGRLTQARIDQMVTEL